MQEKNDDICSDKTSKLLLHCAVILFVLFCICVDIVSHCYKHFDRFNELSINSVFRKRCETLKIIAFVLLLPVVIVSR